MDVKSAVITNEAQLSELDSSQDRIALFVAQGGIGSHADLRGRKRKARERGDQFLRVGVLWRAKDLRWRTTFDNFAVLENGDAMTKRRDGEQIVRNIKDAHTQLTVELRKQAQDFRLSDRIQGAGGLIGNEERRAVEDSHRDDDTLGLADAQLGRAATQKIVVVWETDVRQRGADCGGTFFSRAVRVSAPGFTELRADTQSRVEGGQRTLQNDTYFTAAQGSHLCFSPCE